MAAQTPSGDSNAKLMGLLAYIIAPIGGIIILVSENMKNDPVLKKHAIQGIIAVIVASVIFFLLSAITLGIGACLAWVVYIPLIIWGIQAYQGKDVNIPVITDFGKKQGWFV